MEAGVGIELVRCHRGNEVGACAPRPYPSVTPGAARCPFFPPS